MSIIESIRYKRIVRPLRTTFATALGRKDMMASALVTVRLDDGSMGLGECPTSLAFGNETIDLVEEGIRRMAPQLKGTPIAAYGVAIETLRKQFPQSPMTLSGLETALFRASLAWRGEAEHAYFGGKLNSLETDITIPYLTDWEGLEGWMRYALRKGFTSYKIKVGADMAGNKELVAEVYRRLRESTEAFTVRLDGNQGFTEKTALSFLDFLAADNYPVELFEQPLARHDYKGLKEVKKRSPVPIILDETIFNEADVKHAAEEDLCHGVNIKIAKSGIHESLRIYERAKSYNLKLMMGCMTETMTGLSVAINLAAGKGDFDYIDLDGVHFLHHRNMQGPIRIQGNRYLLSAQQSAKTENVFTK